MTIFKRQPTTNHNQFETISRTYATFGITAPTRAVDIKKLVNAEGASVQATAHRLALEALTTSQDPEEWHADALAAIRDAQA